MSGNSCLEKSYCLILSRYKDEDFEIARADCGITELHHVAFGNDLHAVEGLLAAGFNVNCKNKCGLTPLRIAVQKENKEVCEMLLARGANINVPDVKGRSPLQVAFDKDNEEMVDLLLAYRIGC